MILNTAMLCNKCKSNVKVKATTEFISLKCKCKCVVHYPSGEVSEIPVEEYNKNHKGVDNE